MNWMAEFGILNFGALAGRTFSARESLQICPVDPSRRFPLKTHSATVASRAFSNKTPHFTKVALFPRDTDSENPHTPSHDLHAT
jgi:hypothetical protein